MFLGALNPSFARVVSVETSVMVIGPSLVIMTTFSSSLRLTINISFFLREKAARREKGTAP